MSAELPNSSDEVQPKEDQNPKTEEHLDDEVKELVNRFRALYVDENKRGSVKDGESDEKNTKTDGTQKELSSKSEAESDAALSGQLADLSVEDLETVKNQILSKIKSQLGSVEYVEVDEVIQNFQEIIKNKRQFSKSDIEREDQECKIPEVPKAPESGAVGGYSTTSADVTEKLNSIRDGILNSIQKQLGGAEFPDDVKEKWKESFQNMISSSSEVFKTLNNAAKRVEQLPDAKFKVCLVDLDKNIDSKKLNQYKDDMFSSLKDQLGPEFEHLKEGWDTTFESIIDVLKSHSATKDSEDAWGVEQQKSIMDKLYNTIQAQAGFELPPDAKEKWEAAYLAIFNHIGEQRNTIQK